jgi:serine/threonine protein kinase
MYPGDRGRSQVGLYPPVRRTAQTGVIHSGDLINRRSRSDIKPDNILIDGQGHVKLSDFGLSTGFHKQHDSAYYQKLLGGGNGSENNSPNLDAGRSNAGARNSVMVNAINLQMTSKGDIATWKANRRKLAYSTVGTPDYVSNIDVPSTPSRFKCSSCLFVGRIRSLPKFSCKKVTERSAIGGLWEPSCMSVLSVGCRRATSQRRSRPR